MNQTGGEVSVTQRVEDFLLQNCRPTQLRGIQSQTRRAYQGINFASNSKILGKKEQR